MLNTQPAAAPPAVPVDMAAPSPTSLTTPTTVRVPLIGKHGAGLSMRLDVADWEDIQAAYGREFRLHPNGHGLAYVTCNRRCHGRADVSATTARLARLIVGAKRGEAVIHRDRDQLNLCRANLLHLDREAARAWRKEAAAAASEAARR